MIRVFKPDTLQSHSGELRVCDHIKRSLSIYEKASGQQVNFDKSALIYSKFTSTSHIQYIKDCLKVHQRLFESQRMSWP